MAKNGPSRQADGKIDLGKFIEWMLQAGPDPVLSDVSKVCNGSGGRPEVVDFLVSGRPEPARASQSKDFRSHPRTPTKFKKRR